MKLIYTTVVFLFSTISLAADEKKVLKTDVPSKLIKNNKDVCTSLKIDTIFKKKTLVDKALQEQMKTLEDDKKLSRQDKDHRLKVIEIILREMNDSVSSVYDSISTLDSLLMGDNASLLKLKATSEKRLKQLQNSMLNAEHVSSLLVSAVKEEKDAKKRNKRNKSSSSVLKKFMDELLSYISVAADKLESRLDDDAFKHEMLSQKKFAVQTVIKVGGQESTGEDNEGIVMLVDSNSNHFVLSKPKDSTTTHIDHILLKEIIFVTSLSFILVLVCNYLHLPSNFACILTGVLLGPSGGNYLTSIVQIETMGEFGVFFILFSVGLEFSPEKLRKVLRESTTGVFGIFVSLLMIGVFWGTMFGFNIRQSTFITMSLTFSSTPLITKLLKSYLPSKDHTTRDSLTDDYVHLLLAILVIEDGLIGILMALLPIIAGHSSVKSHSLAHVPSASIHTMVHGTFGGPTEEVFFTAFELVVGLAAIFIITYVISKYAAARFFKGLQVMSTSESYVLGIMTSVFVMLLITEYCGISMELGCFICGGIIGNVSDQISKQVTATLEPFKDFFSALFFASIGFHVFPSFVASEIVILIPITTLVIVTKFAVSSGVMHYVLPKDNNSNKWIIAAGLAQMSEFSFLLGSRARRFGLIGREVYLMILSVTTLSLLFSPFIWKIMYLQNGLWWNVRAFLKKFLL